VDEAAAARTDDPEQVPHADVTNYMEQALRVIGAWIDEAKARDVFFFEQEGSFVLRLLHATAGGAIGHQLAEFTKQEIVAMIEAAPHHRGEGEAATPGTAAPHAAAAETTGEASQ
jgi:hypothetical protein